MDASENMELYDIETGTEPYLEGVWLAGEVSENSTPEAMTEAVYQKQKKCFKTKGNYSRFLWRTFCIYWFYKSSWRKNIQI